MTDLVPLPAEGVPYARPTNQEDTVTQPEPCTTTAKTKRHYSASLAPDKHAPRRPGRRGRTLCGNTGIDAERADYERSLWGGIRKPLDLAKLPECKRCAKAKGGTP